MNEIIEQFRENVKSVSELVNFDRVVLDFAIAQVQSLRNAQGIERLQATAVENAVKALQNVRKNDSLRPKYQVIFNQCVVLLVSYFGSMVGDLFKSHLADSLKNGLVSPACRREEIKLSLGELEAISYDILSNIGEVVVSAKNISFQDMQSIARAFHDWLGYEPEQDRDVNNIILSQACRHAIVHSGGMVDKRLTNQVRNATPRDLKLDLAENEPIRFSPDEIEVVGKSMIRYVEGLVNGLASRRTGPAA
jgi:hypothetical protein